MLKASVFQKDTKKNDEVLTKDPLSIFAEYRRKKK